VYSWFFPLVELFSLLTTAVIIASGGILITRDQVTLGTVIAFVLYLSNLFGPLQNLSSLMRLLQSGGAGLTKLFGVLDTTVEITARPGAIELPASGALVVDQVSFTYDGRTPVLDDVNLSVEPGERLAVVGPTGAGKSTLAKVMARLYDPTEGRVTYGDVDLRDATIPSLKGRIAIVSQEGFLFSGTVRDNVRIGRAGASDAEVEEALDAIGILHRFAALPEGLDTEVQARGSRLSAGERQLVSLARIALARPSVLILDEATSNVDPGTERLVERAMDSLTRDRTVIVIAHRLTTAERADRVAVVDDGRLVEVGQHRDLIARGGRYAALHRSWLGNTAVPGDGDAADAA
jgi:ATP-binding cassette subfamily B protein